MRRKRNERFENLGAEKDMRLHGFPFFGIQRATLVQNGFGDADFADVVQNGGEANLFNFGFGHAKSFGKKRGISRNFLRMSLRVLVLGIYGVSQGSYRIKN